MAIGTTPLFSKISGSAGPVDYRTRRNGKIEIGKKRIPANPQSTRQLEVRAGYGRLYELWQNASYIDKTQYERLGKIFNVSSWNAFLMRHQPSMCLAPIASWGLVENSGLYLHDLTINDNLGTVSGPTWEKTGKAELSTLYYDGIDDRTQIANTGTLNNLSTLSLLSWVAPAVGYGQVFPRLWDKVGSFRGFFDAATGILYADIEDDAGQFQGMVNSVTAISTTEPTQLAVTLNATPPQKLRLYINGLQVHTGLTLTNPTTSTSVFSAGGSAARYYNGHIHQTDFYNYELSPAAILNYYNGSKQLYGVYP